MAVRFINCDLEIESPRSLEYVLTDLLGPIQALSYQKTERGYFAGFELSIYQSYERNSIIARFCDVIEQIGDDARATWIAVFYRKFDLGYECDSNPGFYRSELRAKTVRRAAALGASLSVTIYTRDIADVDEDCPPHEEATNGQCLPKDLQHRIRDRHHRKLLSLRTETGDGGPDREARRLGAGGHLCGATAGFRGRAGVNSRKARQ